MPRDETGHPDVIFVECKPSRAICANCDECEAFFDNNVTFFSIAQKVALHRRGRGHKRFTFWTVKPKGEQQ